MGQDGRLQLVAPARAARARRGVETGSEYKGGRKVSVLIYIPSAAALAAHPRLDWGPQTQWRCDAPDVGTMIGRLAGLRFEAPSGCVLRPPRVVQLDHVLLQS